MSSPQAAPQVRWEYTAGGATAFIGAQKVAVLTTHQHASYDPRRLTGEQVAAWKDHGRIPWSLMPSSAWAIRLCSPEMKVDELRALLDALPEPQKEPGES